MHETIIRTAFAGIDVSAKTLQVAIGRGSDFDQAEFDNDAKGHAKLARYLVKGRKAADVRVCIEATGVYSKDVCRHLFDKKLCVFLVNPRATKNFASALMLRAKTDPVDAKMLADFVKKMPLHPWKPRRDPVEEFVAVARHLTFVVHGLARQRTHLHSLGATVSTPAFVLQSLQEEIAAGELRVDAIEKEALRLIRADTQLRSHLEHFLDVPGVAKRTAIAVLAYFAGIADELDADQVVAHAGLDPRPRESGARTPSTRSISRRGDSRIRQVLYMASLSASHREGPFQTFYDRLVARNKPKKVALIAVMRKLLVVLWTLYRTNAAYEANRVGKAGPP